MSLTPYQRQVRKELLQIIANPHNEADNVTIVTATQFFDFLKRCSFPVTEVVAYPIYPVDGRPFVSLGVLKGYEISEDTLINAQIFTSTGKFSVAWLITHYNNNGKGLTGFTALYKMIMYDENLYSLGNFLLTTPTYFDALSKVLPRFE